MNPFLAHLDRLAALLDTEPEDLGARITRLDQAVAAGEGHGLSRSPQVDTDALGRAVGLGRRRLWACDETGAVGGSHKARHLFATALALGLDSGRDAGDELAIASCGNAALGAAVVARALERRLRVFVPVDADPGVLARLHALGADVVTCRRQGRPGDPCLAALEEALEGGAVAFSVQGTLNPWATLGSRVMGWEVADRWAAGIGPPQRLFVQIGGGALAAGLAAGIADAVAAGTLEQSPRLHPVQAEGCAPLARAWARLGGRSGTDLAPAPWQPRRAAALGDPAEAEETARRARAEPDRWMTPWEPTPSSAATGILDDVTYDWLGVLDAMTATGGWPVVAPEAMVGEAHRLVRAHTGVPADPTGTAGLAGLLALLGAGPDAGAPGPDERCAVLFTGGTTLAGTTVAPLHRGRP